jgi:Family of unknown function (DUF6529)
MTVPLDAPVPRRNLYLLLPLGLGAVVALALGVYGGVHHPTGQALYTGPFSSMFAMKVWLTAVALVLALVQLATALWMYGKLPWPAPDWIGAFHRGTGSLAFVVTLPVAFHCLWALGFQPTDARVLAHSLLGCLFYGAFVAKILTLTSRRVPGWALPWVAGALFTALIAVGLTSAVWYFVTIGVPK